MKHLPMERRQAYVDHISCNLVLLVAMILTRPPNILVCDCHVSRWGTAETISIYFKGFFLQQASFSKDEKEVGM
jgi:hypothetical protein